jgi:glycosyltransferase involved in cell wall biosynthesis
MPRGEYLMSISAVINTLNEEANIAECIRSVESMANEIIVCDMHSDDATVKIAERLGARIIYHDRTGYVEPARYYAITQASSEWVLVIDADERMTDSLKEKLVSIAKNDDADIVLFGSLFNYFGGYVRHGGFFSLRWPRFFKKSIYTKEFNEKELMVHGNFRNLEKSPSRKIFLPETYHILHEAYPTIEKYVVKTVGMYSRLEAEQLYQSGKRFSKLQMVVEPCKIFFKKYFFLGGYKDGVRGFILAVLYAAFRFCMHANLWFFHEKAKSSR